MAPTATTKSKPKLDVTVNKPNPYTFDLGLLLANDPNPISTSQPSSESDSSLSEREAQLSALARDGAQSLINQLLSTCPISSTSSGVLLSLPASSTLLPREKPLPAPKPPTKWEQFAARKGIKPKTREQRRMKSQAFNEDSQTWERTWGYDGRDRRRRQEEGLPQKDWLVEVDEQKEAEDKMSKKGGNGNKKKGGKPSSSGGANKKRRTA